MPVGLEGKCGHQAALAERSDFRRKIKPCKNFARKVRHRHGIELRLQGTGRTGAGHLNVLKIFPGKNAAAISIIVISYYRPEASFILNYWLFPFLHFCRGFSGEYRHIFLHLHYLDRARVVYQNNQQRFHNLFHDWP